MMNLFQILKNSKSKNLKEFESERMKSPKIKIRRFKQRT